MPILAIEEYSAVMQSMDENAGIPCTTPSTITYQVERWPDIPRTEMDALFQLHWEEIAGDKNKIKLDVDYDLYAQLAENGGIHIVTVRDAGRLVGYNCMFIHTNLHYKGVLMAASDVYFLMKEYRRGSIGIRMFKFVEESLRAIGVKKVFMNTKVWKDNSVIFDRLGFHEVERLWCKYIGD